MKNPAIYKVNDKALNNGEQIKHSGIITILNKELREVAISDCQKNAGQAQGCKVCVRGNSSTIDTSNLPENIIHIIGENVFVETETLTDKQRDELFKDIVQDQMAIEDENIVEAVKEAILNGNDRKTALAKVVYENTGEFKRTIYIVLEGLEGKLWRMTRGPHNSKVYSLL